MDSEIISYIEMCQREGLSLQKGINFLGDRAYTVVLMSVRPNAASCRVRGPHITTPSSATSGISWRYLFYRPISGRTLKLGLIGR